MYNLEDFKNKTWYHQRFDGCPLFLFLIGEAETAIDSTRPINTGAAHRICFFEDGKADWFLDIADIRSGAEAVVSQSKNNPQWSEEIMEKYVLSENNFNNFCKKFQETQLLQLTDYELLQIFKEFHSLAVKRFTSSATIDHFALGTDTIIAEMIRKEAGPFSSESEFNQAFSILTAPIHQSFINEAEVSLLRIAQVSQVKGLSNAEVIESVKQHTEKYFWIKNNYINGEKATETAFINELEIILKSNLDLEEAIKKITSTAEQNKLKKQILLSSNKISSDLQNLLHISENFTHWQDERKKASYWCAYIGTYILKEMSKRRFIPINQLKYLIAHEIEDWFSSNKQDFQIQDRKKFCAIIYTATDFKILIQEEAKKLQNIVDPKDLSGTPNDIRGLVANPGLVRGTARIILSANDINLVQPGDILIAVMTRPDYVPGMKKAAAVVTDEGGITSHAAIVSRELGVPCIIGTKIATRVFKNGDLLEVNANHGVVKKLS